MRDIVALSQFECGELSGNVEVRQACESLTRHRARKHIAPDHDVVDAFSSDLVEYGLECGKVAMNVVECGDRHGAF
jgi:hypothetical protein